MYLPTQRVTDGDGVAGQAGVVGQHRHVDEVDAVAKASERRPGPPG